MLSICHFLLMLSDFLTNKQSVVHFKVYILTLGKQRRDGGSLENGDCDKRTKFAILLCRKLTVGKGSALILRQARRKDLQYSYHSEVTTLEETAPIPNCAQRTVCTASKHLTAFLTCTTTKGKLRSRSAAGGGQQHSGRESAFFLGKLTLAVWNSLIWWFCPALLLLIFHVFGA